MNINLCVMLLFNPGLSHGLPYKLTTTATPLILLSELFSHNIIYAYPVS